MNRWIILTLIIFSPLTLFQLSQNFRGCRIGYRRTLNLDFPFRSTVRSRLFSCGFLRALHSRCSLVLVMLGGLKINYYAFFHLVFYTAYTMFCLLGGRITDFLTTQNISLTVLLNNKKTRVQLTMLNFVCVSRLYDLVYSSIKI